MSIYRCDHCEQVCDADQEGVEEHPFKELFCVCERCYEFLIEIDGAKIKIGNSI